MQTTKETQKIQTEKRLWFSVSDGGAIKGIEVGPDTSNAVRVEYKDGRIHYVPKKCDYTRHFTSYDEAVAYQLRFYESVLNNYLEDEVNNVEDKNLMRGKLIKYWKRELRLARRLAKTRSYFMGRQRKVAP